MNTAEKVAALLRFYSARYKLSATDWLDGLIDLEESEPKGGDKEPVNGSWRKYLNPPYKCVHCGAGSQVGMGAARHHTNRHAGCKVKHWLGEKEPTISDG